MDDGFRLTGKDDCVLTRAFLAFEVLVEKVVMGDPARRARFAQVAEAMRQPYEGVVEIEDGQPVLHQPCPCAAYHFKFSSNP